MSTEARLSPGDLVQRLTRLRDRFVTQGRLRSAAEVERAIAQARADTIRE